MGVVADAVLAGGGRTIGVITSALADHEIARRGLHRLDVVDTMHERKARRAELSDAVIMLPDGFYDLLLRFLEEAVDQGFIARNLVEGLVVSRDPDDLVRALLKAGPN